MALNILVFVLSYSACGCLTYAVAYNLNEQFRQEFTVVFLLWPLFVIVFVVWIFSGTFATISMYLDNKVVQFIKKVQNRLRK